MAHQPDQLLNTKNSFINESQHGDKRELKHGHSRSGFRAPSLLVAELVWSMVRSDASNLSFRQCPAQCIAVLGSFHSRVAFDERFSGSIVVIGKQQMSKNGFSGNLRERPFIESMIVHGDQAELLGCREMGDMQSGTVGLGKIDGQ